MKYLKKYKLFTESEFDVNLTDATDIKMSKERLNTLKKNILDFKVKKPLIDSTYLLSISDTDLNTKIESIVGKTDALPTEDRNPFIVEYLHVANLKRKLNNLQKEITNDKLSKDDFQEEMKLAVEASTKEAVNKKITDITNRISTKTASVQTISAEITKSESDLNNKMSKIEKDMKDYISKINSENI